MSLKAVERFSVGSCACARAMRLGCCVAAFAVRDAGGVTEIGSRPPASKAASLTDELPASTTSSVAVIARPGRDHSDGRDGIEASFEKLGKSEAIVRLSPNNVAHSRDRRPAYAACGAICTGFGGERACPFPEGDSLR